MNTLEDCQKSLVIGNAQNKLPFKKLEKGNNTLKIMCEPTKHMYFFPMDLKQEYVKPIPRYLFTIFDFNDKKTKLMWASRSLARSICEEIERCNLSKKNNKYFLTKFLSIFKQFIFTLLKIKNPIELPVIKIRKNTSDRKPFYSYDVKLISWENT